MITFGVIRREDKNGWGVLVNTTESPDLPAGDSSTIGMAIRPDRRTAIAEAAMAARGMNASLYVEGEVHPSEMDLTEGVTIVHDAPTGIATFVSLVKVVSK